jgi:hypothetical protein
MLTAVSFLDCRPPPAIRGLPSMENLVKRRRVGMGKKNAVCFDLAG